MCLPEINQAFKTTATVILGTASIGYAANTFGFQGLAAASIAAEAIARPELFGPGTRDTLERTFHAPMRNRGINPKYTWNRIATGLETMTLMNLFRIGSFATWAASVALYNTIRITTAAIFNPAELEA